MASGKQTPRQKLIGLMYLVFLALMALQISREALDSVVLIDNEINQTNISLGQRIESTLGAFRSQMTIAEERVRPIYEDALEVQRLSNEIVNAILEKRTEMISQIDGISMDAARELDLSDLKNKDNYSSTTRFWLTTSELDAMVTGGPGSRAYELKNLIAEYKENLLPILEKNKIAERVKLGLDVEKSYPNPGGGADFTWQQNMFDRVIPVAVAANLTRLVTEVRNTEFDIVNNLYSRIAADSYTFDKVAAALVPSSTIVMQGGYYEADVFVTAYDSKQAPFITLQGSRIPVEDGVGKIRIPASSPGQKSFSGRIEIPDPSGNKMFYDFKGDFVVQPPSATVSPTKMNVVYIGLDNPMSISSPGVPTDKLRASATGGTLTPTGGGTYNLIPSAGAREVVISVSAVDGGSSRNMGSQTFRVRPIPPPTPYIAGKREGRISREELALAGSIIPRLENFEFDYNYQIASFTMLANIGGDVKRFVGNGNRFTPEMVSAINSAARGQVVTFMEILTRPGPDGRTLNLGSISFNIL